MEYETRVTKVVVLPKGEPLFSEQATTIEIQDEAGGEFVKVSQEGGHTDYAKHICFSHQDWEAIKPEIDRMLTECRDDKGNLPSDRKPLIPVPQQLKTNNEN